MSTTRITPRQKLLAVVLAVVLLATACDDDERRGIRLTPTSTVETGVRALVDNCPGPTSVALTVRDDVLWQIDAPPTDQTQDTEDLALDGDLDSSQPGIAEFVIGQTPADWNTAAEMIEPLQPGTRYTVRTEPDGQSIDFSTPDLAGGLLWDGLGNSRFNPNLIDVECSQPADIGAFTQNLLVLGLLGAVSIALVLVAIILLLFVVTRRFSRVRSIQRKSTREAPRAKPQRPRARSRT